MNVKLPKKHKGSFIIVLPAQRTCNWDVLDSHYCDRQRGNILYLLQPSLPLPSLSFQWHKDLFSLTLKNQKENSFSLCLLSCVNCGFVTGSVCLLSESFTCFFSLFFFFRRNGSSYLAWCMAKFELEYRNWYISTKQYFTHNNRDVHRA